MRNFVGVLLAGGLLVAANAAVAQDEEVEYGWAGKGEFGFVNTTGNTDSTAINFKLEFINNTETWRHRLTSTALYTEEDSIQDNERYTFEAQSDRKLNEKSYIFGAFRWDADKFGSYDPQMSLTAGYGYQLMKSETHELKGEIGAGWRKLEERESGVTSDEPIVRLLLDDSWQVMDSLLWTNRLLVEAGSDNTFSLFNTAAKIAMNDKLAVSVGFEVRNNTEVPPGDSEATDTITTVNLVYNF